MGPRYLADISGISTCVQSRTARPVRCRAPREPRAPAASPRHNKSTKRRTVRSEPRLRTQSVSARLPIPSPLPHPHCPSKRPRSSVGSCSRIPLDSVCVECREEGVLERRILRRLLQVAVHLARSREDALDACRRGRCGKVLLEYFSRHADCVLRRCAIKNARDMYPCALPVRRRLAKC